MFKGKWLVLVLFFCVGLVASAQEVPAKKNKIVAKKETISTNKLVIKTYNTINVGWGFDIYQNGKMLIHQPHIPAVPGTNGFKTEVDAKKVGALMQKKIERKILPPTIEIKELDSLKIKY